MPFDAEHFVVTDLPVHPSVSQPERIRTLRDAIRAAPQDFDMRDPAMHTCGTAVCFHGWVKELFFGKYVTTETTSAHLGLSPQQGADLYQMWTGNAEPCNLNRRFRDITAQEGVRVLNHYLATGEIDWSVA